MNFKLSDYFSELSQLLIGNEGTQNKLIEVSKIFKETKKNKIIIIGNGGSAAIASHVSVDLSKNAHIKAINFNEADLITCLANDYGHENWMKEALRIYCENDDIVVLISSSGNSNNICNAATYCIENKIKLITFSGMDFENKLNQINKNGNVFWLDSYAYNHIEMVHQGWLLAIVDMCIGEYIYKSN